MKHEIEGGKEGKRIEGFTFVFFGGEGEHCIFVPGLGPMSDNDLVHGHSRRKRPLRLG